MPLFALLWPVPSPPLHARFRPQTPPFPCPKPHRGPSPHNLLFRCRLRRRLCTSWRRRFHRLLGLPRSLAFLLRRRRCPSLPPPRFLHSTDLCSPRPRCPRKQQRRKGAMTLRPFLRRVQRAYVCHDMCREKSKACAVPLRSPEPEVVGARTAESKSERSCTETATALLAFSSPLRAGPIEHLPAPRAPPRLQRHHRRGAASIVATAHFGSRPFSLSLSLCLSLPLWRGLRQGLEDAGENAAT